MKNCDYLKAIPVFANLPDALLALIDQHTLERQLEKGETIFFEGEAGEGFHYVIAGQVKIIKTSEDGREHIIKVMQPGELFAEVLLFNSLPYPATAIAVESARVGMIRNVDLERLVLGNNQLALQLIKALSQRLLYAQQKIKNLALDDVLSRTAEVLLRLAGEQVGKEKTPEIKLDFSRQDLASLVGTTRETVTRTLSALKKDAIIDFEGSRIRLLDVDYLKSLVS
ncbi:Crp/Fnr family transcriptional regulator [Azotosporobacter soli]|uniref:Crp/Fnr family transcriptional regulator n=1 Tax=Azotosporobacter soli TaxID=3055040 RepID=UPI0031FEC979